MTRAWTPPVLLSLCGLFAAAGPARGGNLLGAAAYVLLFALLAGAVSPLVFPRPVGAAEALRRSADDGRPVVYWRPGCAYCLRLRLRLGRAARRAHWVDIWRDPAGAARVREAAAGNETVPTVVVAGRAHVNPDPAWVRAQLGRRG
ncbi:glutaredoxin domain-containing protein [Streptomyces sp. CRN 30]|uniref:glutaredoxin domain-containing protein n=1 Tax=Streptomyces sp. CRN 30 TaxID=3075613 RepID=UPI002A83B290|nr:glutaredoxin domain-containing protein [Streptomyces sp. CRN 30]